MLRALTVALVLLLAPAGAQARTNAPGAPGAAADWAAAAKHGLGTARSASSRVWFTLSESSLTEVFFPDVTHPSARGVDLLVDGRPAAGRATVSESELAYTQTVTARRYVLTRIYVTDPHRNVVLIRVHLQSRDERGHALTVAYDPQLYGTGDDDVGWTRGHALLSHDAHVASALLARPAFADTSSGYKGHDAHLLDHDWDALHQGNVVQAAATTLTGLAHHQDATLALAFAPTALAARAAGAASLDAGFDATASAYAAGWQAYQAALRPMPASALAVQATYQTSLLLLKAAEDKASPGAFATKPAATGNAPTADVTYDIATALLAAGDTASANQAVDYLFDHGKPDALSVVLAWQLGRIDRWDGVKQVADALTRPATDPAGEADEIAALICAAGIARSNHDEKSAARYESLADGWVKALRTPADIEFTRLGIEPAAKTAVGRSTPTPGALGEYVLAGGRSAAPQLAQLAQSADDGGLIGGGDAAAQAQFVRLAWSIEAGHPIETPAIVAARYANRGG